MEFLRYLQSHDMEINNTVSALADAVTIAALVVVAFFTRGRLRGLIRVAVFYVIAGCLLHIWISVLRVLHVPLPGAIAQSWSIKDVGMAMLVVGLFVRLRKPR